jgi:trypsin
MKTERFSFKMILRALSLFIFAAMFSTVFCQSAQAHPTGQIVGGDAAAQDAWPFQAALMDPSLSQFCGGSLIASTWILTAAHCVTEDNGSVTSASSIRVGMGFNRLSQGGAVFNVSHVYRHPSYDSNTMAYDFALLELSSAASQAPLLLNFTGTDLAGQNAIVTGWGTLSSGGASPDELRQVTVPVVSNATCSSQVSGITPQMLCAGTPGKDSCQGDSGGPLFLLNGSTVTQIGVVSFGEGCGDSYGVYARVSEAESFIRSHVTINPLVAANGKYGLWNGYLGMTNILELINRSGSAVTAQVNFFGLDGTLVSTNYFAVSGTSQLDVIVNSLPGFRADNYGIIQVSNNIDGRIMYYRGTNGVFQNFDFVFGVALSDAMTGDSNVGFNTYQPSFNSAEIGYQVANWLSVVNLAGTSKNFNVAKYDSAGSLLGSSGVSIGASTRLDLEGGHQNPGPSNVGLIRISPSDSSGPYLAQLMRYGYGAGGAFEFAFPLIAKPGSTTIEAVPLGSTFLAQNWLEVINVGSAANDVRVNIYNVSGSLVNSQTLSIPAHGQTHLNVNQILGDQALGSATLVSLSGQPMTAESMFYYRATSGSISSMYGSQSRAAVGTAATGSYNLYLGMSNYLKLVNPNSSATSANLTITSSAASGSSRTVNLAAFETKELSLHDTSTYGTASDSYGSVVVTPTSPSLPLVHEVLRLRTDTSSQVEFTAPTGLQ